MLGERIRKLRKQKKLTLDALAGDKLTKGMLSLIENNKANPSMESLTYISEQLGVEVTDLLGNISSQELRQALEQAEKLFNFGSDETTDTNKTKQIISLIEPMIPNLVLGYESARLLDIYGRSLHSEKNPGWESILHSAADMYEQLNLTSRRADIGILRAKDKFVEHSYTEALAIFLAERSDIEANHAFINSITRLDLDYYEAIFYFAAGEANSAIDIMEQAIEYSKEHRIFYRIDDLYRLASANAMMTDDEKKEAYYLNKLRQYGEFADDQQTISFINLMTIFDLIKKHDHSGALDLIDQTLADPEASELDEAWYFLCKGEALYGLGNFSEALNYFEKVYIPSYLHHPFDLAFFYEMDSYLALCHFELKNYQNAIQSAEKAVKQFTSFPDSPYKDFSNNTYELIKARNDEME